MRKLLLTAAACGAALAFALPSSAAVTCGTDAAATVAASTVVDRGSNWSQPGQPDLWEVTFPNGDSVDLYATDAGDASSKAQAFLQGEIDQACAAQAQNPPAAPSSPASGGGSSAPTGDQSGIASVTYVGDAWGPVPIWRVTYNDGNSVDVAATDSASAVAVITPSNGTPPPPPATSAPSSVSSGQAFTSGTLAPPPNSPDSPAAQYALLNG